MLTYVDQPVLQSELPQDATSLKDWFIEVLALAPAGSMGNAVREVEDMASQRFPTKLVVHLLRQVLTDDLLGHD